MKCPDCGENVEYINGVPVCPVCDEPMNKTLDDDKWVQERKDDSSSKKS